MRGCCLQVEGMQQAMQGMQQAMDSINYQSQQLQARALQCKRAACKVRLRFGGFNLAPLNLTTIKSQNTFMFEIPKHSIIIKSLSSVLMILRSMALCGCACRPRQS